MKPLIMRQCVNRDIQIVELRSPIKQWDDPRVYDLFHKLVDLKLQGYGSGYPEGVLAVDGTDFFARHLLICQVKESRLVPLMGFKSTSLKQCEFHRVNFPGLGVLSSSKAHQFLPRLEAVLSSAMKSGRDIAYNGSWTRSLEVAQNKAFSHELRDIVTAILVFLHHNSDVPEWIACGAQRFKTDRYLESLGGYPISDYFNQHSLAGEAAVMLHFKQFTEEALLTARKHENLWESRLILGQSNPGERTKAA